VENGGLGAAIGYLRAERNKWNPRTASSSDPRLIDQVIQSRNSKWIKTDGDNDAHDDVETCALNRTSSIASNRSEKGNIIFSSPTRATQ